MKRCISYLTISMALLSFAVGQSATPPDSENSKSKQEVRQAIEKYSAALLQRDVPTLEKIWADDCLVVVAAVSAADCPSVLECEVGLDAATAALTSYLASLRYSPVALDVARALFKSRAST